MKEIYTFNFIEHCKVAPVILSLSLMIWKIMHVLTRTYLLYIAKGLGNKPLYDYIKFIWGKKRHFLMRLSNLIQNSSLPETLEKL